MKLSILESIRVRDPEMLVFIRDWHLLVRPKVDVEKFYVMR